MPRPMPKPVTKDTLKWCNYLAALHSATDGAITIPISPKCTRPTVWQSGCGTCYQCTIEVVQRVLHATTLPLGHCPARAHEITEAVFSYVTSLDPQHLADDYNEDFAPMTSEQYERVMAWAANITAAEKQALLSLNFV
jgi:hypothetical protein